MEFFRPTSIEALYDDIDVFSGPNIVQGSYKGNYTVITKNGDRLSVIITYEGGLFSESITLTPLTISGTRFKKGHEIHRKLSKNETIDLIKNVAVFFKPHSYQLKDNE